MIGRSVNVKGVYLGSKWALAQMVEQQPDASGKRGRLLNIASIFGLTGATGGGMRGSESEFFQNLFAQRDAF